jgi:hypothetical protein
MQLPQTAERLMNEKKRAALTEITFDPSTMVSNVYGQVEKYK